MKKLRVLLLITSMTLFCLTASASYMFRHIGISDGLSQSTVFAIIQDQKGFIWLGTKSGLNRFDGTSMKVYRRHAGASSLGSSYINALFEAKDGRIWIGTDEGVYIYSPKSDTFSKLMLHSSNGDCITNNVVLIKGYGRYIYIAANEQGLFQYDTRNGKMHNYRLAGHPNVAGLGFDSKGTMWIGFFGGGLYYTKDQLHTLHPFTAPNGQKTFNGDIVSCINDIGTSTLMIGSDRHGLSSIDIKTGNIKHIVETDNGKNIFVRAIEKNGNDIWAATEMGLYIYNLKTQKIQHHTYDPSNPFSLSDNPLYCLFRDREMGMWVGSYFGGVNYVPHQNPLFEKYIPRIGMDNSLHGRRVREICQDKNGNVWIGTEDGGLNVFNPRNGLFSYIGESSVFPNVHGLCADGNTMWAGTFSYGLRLIDINSHRVIKTFTADGKPGSLHDNTIFSICRTRKGVILLGSIRGMCRYNRSSSTFEYIKGIPPLLINRVKEDSHGNIWAATQTGGIYCLMAGKTKWKNFNSTNSKLPSDKIISIFEDSEGQMWFSTQDAGICRYDAHRSNFVTVPIPKYAPETTVFQIVEDNHGILWLTTYNGIISYNPQNGESRIYTTANGLLDNQFNYNSSLLDSNGRIYFGSLNGFIRFSPASFMTGTKTPEIVITELLIGKNVANSTSPDSPLSENIVFANDISLSYLQNSFALRVAALSFANAQSHQMEYKLDGYDDNWQHLRSDNLIAYSNLSAGHYTLYIRIKADNGSWSAKQYKLEITVRPHPLLSIWAKIIYFLLFVFGAWKTYKYVAQRTEMKRRHAMERLELEKEQELYQSKIHFFTNVAHEIRTPLTLIKGPLENIINGQKVENVEVKEDLGIMYKNTTRLNDLINQLLDFRKTESNGLRMNFERCNINKIVTGVYDRFRPLMREKNINATLSMPAEILHAYVDHEGLTKIISNLMNNAVKYCASRVCVMLSKQNDDFTLVVMNDGRIIPQSMREKIFKPFFRMDSAEKSSTTGTGIGLAMARSLTELHNGTLMMDDSKEMNIFRLTMPVKQEPTIKLDDDINDINDDTYNDEETEKQEHDHTVLIVEDNQQMLMYEKKQLQGLYNVLTATDGEDALQVLSHHAVDVIVSDVMMEPMNGFELCRTVKNDVNYSHVPIILLTAMTVDSAKREGMDSGADAYVEKPFSMDYLLSIIRNMIRSREDVKKAYAGSPFISSDSVSISKADAEFLSHLNEVMNQNMANNEFNVTQMAEALFMSRSSLNRKIRGTLDLSANDYIKIERLKRAAQLLKTGKSKINEVSYMVGFSTPSYFTKCFVKQFGLLPKDFLWQDKEKEE